MIQPVRSLFALFLGALLATAPCCASVENLLGKTPRPLGGVRLSVKVLGQSHHGLWYMAHPFREAGLFVGMPFSLAVDVALLPITSVMAMLRFPHDWHGAAAAILEWLTAPEVEDEVPPTPVKPKKARTKTPARRSLPWEPSQSIDRVGLTARLARRPGSGVRLWVAQEGEDLVLFVTNTGRTPIVSLEALVSVSSEDPGVIEGVVLELNLGRIQPEGFVRRSLGRVRPNQRVGLLSLSDGDALFGP